MRDHQFLEKSFMDALAYDAKFIGFTPKALSPEPSCIIPFLSAPWVE
jgi:hypothetical protein